MNTKIYYFLTIGTFIFVIGLIMLFYYPTMSPQINTTESSTVSVPIKTLPSNENDSVQAMGVAYKFYGHIKDLKDISGGKELTLDLQGQNVPDVIINKDTTVLFTDEKNEKPANINDLQKSQKVKVFAMFTYTQKQWITTKIFIYIPSLSDLPKK